MPNKTPRRRQPKRTIKSSKPTKTASLRRETNILISKIKSSFHLLITAEQGSMKHFIAIGKAAVQLKESAPPRGFTKLLAEHLPFIDLRQIQRAMRLANAFTFEEHDALYLVPKDHLEKILKVAGKTNPMVFLEENQVDLEFDQDKEEDLQSFLESIKNLAYQPPNPATKTGTNVKNKEPDAKDENANSEPQSVNDSPKLTFRSVYVWIKSYRKAISKEKKKLSSVGTATARKLITEIETFIEEFGAKEDDDNE